ncbi:lysophospholipid acyltransferase family protein [Roseococcus sp. YIM B11640]|uniref:lysophospholipid acyltransferase family protein n=1 Tax=Roseococcus sp. YIM B11640 TaxID=3133973 RepID=UPI003C7CEA6B
MRRQILAIVDRVSIAWMRHAPDRLADAYAGFMARRVVPKLYGAASARARANFARLRPELDAEAAVAAHWDNTARSFLEVPRAIRLFDEGRVAVEGTEHLGGRPLIVAALHLGNWEMVGLAMVRAGSAPVAFYQPTSSELRTRTVVAERIRGGGRLLPVGRDATRPALRALVQDRDVLLVFLDEHQHGRVAAPSLGRGPRSGGNIEVAARLARHSGAAIVVGHCERLAPDASGPRFHVRFEAPIEVPRSDDRDADIRAGVEALDACIEPLILGRITQWLMLPDWKPEG